MNLKKKKQLVARALKIGIKRIKLDDSMKEEIKEAITRQDMKDLKKENIIKIKEKKGRKTNVKRKTKRGKGKRKKIVKKRKQEYVKLTRKLRTYIRRLKETGEISKEIYYDFRKKIRARTFRDFSHLKEAVKKLK